tara:strand:- start:1853 stop:2593 length:741 start_codon:yes stop_codon:yes gene_type:complete
MSTLLQVRTELIDISGRFDLVVNTSAYADAGADIYINKGQRLLEQLVPTWNDLSRRVVALAINDKYIELESTVRSIDEVILVKVSDGSRLSLSELPYNQIYNSYSDLTVSGAPSYWCRHITRPAPQQESGFNPAAFDGTEAMMSTEADFVDNIRLLLNVPVSVAYSAHVFGMFYANDLSGDSDTSYWTSVHPHILVLAALYQMEVHYRNVEDAANMLRELRLQLREVDKDNVQLDMNSTGAISFGG